MPPEKHSPRVRAWVYAVINPWIEALSIENEVLEYGGSSYRWRLRDFEYLRPIKAHLQRGADLILDDLVRYYKEGPRDWQSDHDRHLQRLRSAAQAAFDELHARPSLTEELRQAAVETPELAKQAGGVDEYRSLLTERILNRAQVGYGYVDSDFWTHHRERFLRHRTGPNIESLDSERDKLRSMNEEHSGKLGDLRGQIVDEFDIPPAAME